MSTALESRTDEATDLKVQEPGDHDLFSHYVRKEAILAATIEGTPAIALCGKQWVPTRDGQKFPVCPECHDIYENVVGTRVPGGGAAG